MGNTNSNKNNNFVALFRQKYSEGRIAVNVSQNNGCVMARARIYPNFNDEERCFLSEITVAKNITEENDFASLISEVQEQAIALAIQNAGITCDMNKSKKQEVSEGDKIKEETTDYEVVEEQAPKKVESELTLEEKYQNAIKLICPITKYKEKNYTLGQVLGCDPKAIKWLAEKFTGDTKIKEAAQIICEYAVIEAA